jgi:DNA polymerase III subunit alpha
MTKHAILHAHTEYSTRDSLIRVVELPKIAAEKGWGACAITDHGGVEGVPAFLKAANKVGVKPIAGIELYVACPDTYHMDGRKKGDKLNHLTVLAKNAKGFSSIMSVLSAGHRTNFDTRQRVAAVPLEMVLENLTDCVVLSGCFSGPFWRGTEKAAEDLVRFAERFKGDFYLEVQPHHDWNPQVELNRLILSLANDLKLSFVVTPDCHYAHAHDETFHDSLIAVSARMAKNDPKRTWRFSSKECFLKTPAEAIHGLILSGFPEDMAKQALEETSRIEEKISEWSWNDLPAPRFPDMGGDMRVLVEAGFERLGLRGLPGYDERLQTELSTFQKAGIDRYLILVKHCIDLFRREGGEIGPRGSVGGSLVAYCLGITPLDPLAHNLSWQRFYAPGRKGWPDVDIDLDESTRLRAADILRREFGTNNVAQISNYSEFGLRMAIKDAAKAYGIKLEDDSKFDISEKDYENIEDIAPGAELAKKSADAAAFARMLVGRVRQFGAHAGGFVLSPDPLTSGRAAIVHRGKDTALPWDMKTAEELGFIKLDFLGLDALSAIKTINETVTVNWKEVPLDDAVVIKDFADGHTAGVPQFLSPGLKSFIRQVKPTKFGDLVWATSAFRPGALGQRTPEELARAYQKDPNEILVFQEDVMGLCVECAGFTWTEATSVQKTMAKSQGIEAMGEWTDKFVNGCVKTIDADPELAKEFWEKLLNFGRYAFNRAHATAYSWNSYRIAWAKRHHPATTFLALLRIAADEKRQSIVDEAPKFGVEIIPPDPNRSDLDWRIEGNAIIMPLTMADGMDLRLAKLVMKKRVELLSGKPLPYRDEDDMHKRLAGYKYPEYMVTSLFSGLMPGQNFAREAFNPRGIYTKTDLDEFTKKEGFCTLCPFSKKDICKYGVVPIEFGATNVMVVGEAPGWEESKKHRPFVGASGRMLDSVFMRFGVNSKKLTWTNVSHCQPPFLKGTVGEAMTRSEAERHAAECPWLDDEIKMLRPPLILAVGKKAWSRLVDKRESITKANATVRDVNGTKVVGCLHPAFVMRDESRKADFETAIQKFAELYKILYPNETPERRLPEEISMAVKARSILGVRRP